MPLLQLNLTDVTLTEGQRGRLLDGLTRRMATLLGKRADLTVVNISQSPSGAWSLGGVPLQGAGWCASLVVHITAGTNTADEQSTFIASAYKLLEDVLGGPPRAPVYIIANEIPAHSWGYDGRTQLDRRPPPARTSQRPLTLRELSAAQAAPTFGTTGVALLLIDFQREYAPDGRLPLVGLGAAAAQAQRLVDVFDAQSRPVVHVHQKSPFVAGVLFAHGEPGAQPLAIPAVAAHHHRIDKGLPSAFSGTALAEMLTSQGIKQLVIAGAMTHHCVDSTARAAMHLGLEVVVVSDACATRALPGASEGQHSADEVHANALAALADRHAVVAPTRQVLEWLQPA